MLKYIVRRLLLLIPILLGLSVFMIVFIHALPGDPCASILGEHTNTDRLAACRHGLGLDKPLYEQYFDYMGRLVHGDLGTSATNRVSVTTSFLTRFPATVELTLAAMLVSIGFGIPLGVAAAKRQGSIFDNLATVLSLLGISIPIFFLGLLLAYVFGVWLHWLPVIGRYDLRNYDFTRRRDELPALGVAGDRPQHPQVHRRREAPHPAGHRPRARSPWPTSPGSPARRCIEVLNEDYVRTARAKGLTHRAHRQPPRPPQRDAADRDGRRPPDRACCSVARS